MSVKSIPNPRELIVCKNCFFNGGKPEILRNRLYDNEVACYANPDDTKIIGTSTKHMVAIVDDRRWCRHWRDVRTLENIDDIMEKLR